MKTFTIEKIADNVIEIGELAKLHYDESCPYDDIPLCIDWTRFLRLEEAGISRLYVYKDNNKIIGYALFMMITPIEYATSLQASLSNIFIHPDHRGNGTNFIEWCDEQLKGEGVQVVNHHVKAKNDYGKLLKRLGYSIMNIEYSKRLDK